MDDAPPSAQPLGERLGAYRDEFARRGPLGMRQVPSLGADFRAYEPTSQRPADQGAWFELMAYDALCLGRPGWGFVCMRAAEVGLSEAERPDDLARARAASQRILEACFPPYEGEAAILGDVQEWLWARTIEITGPPDVAGLLQRRDGPRRLRPDPLTSESLALRHRWMFRLIRTYQVGRGFRMDRVLAAFGLGNQDQLLLRVLVAAHADRVLERVLDPHRSGRLHLTVGLLVDLLGDGEADRATWARRFDARAPLRRYGLVHLSPAEGLEQPLGTRAVDVDESILAAFDGRDWWPGELEGLVTLHEPPARPPSARITATVDRLVALPAPQRVHLVASSAGASLDVVGAWSARRASGRVLRCTPAAVARADVRRAVARQSRLRDALVLVDGEVSESDARALADLAGQPVVLHHDRASGWPIGIVHEPPAGDAAVLAWNVALAEAGLAELAPGDVGAHLVPLALDEADMRAVARTGQPHGPRLAADVLAALAARVIRPSA